MKKKYKIGVIGMGYVGLPLAVELSKKYKTIGFDINNNRVNELKKHIDSTFEVSSKSLKSVVRKNKDTIGLYLTSKNSELKECNFYIVAVPTPTTKNKYPDFKPLISASNTIGPHLKKGDIVVYESTVYPGATEDICVPCLERSSNLIFNKDFFVGYSPERINPGDKVRTLTNIVKITSGSTKKVAQEIDSLYKTIITAGTFLADSIKVAEAAKIIENCQRDVNIAFVNELAKIFNIMKIDTTSVLKAASTKWNFLHFKPGLVGGHCIGVDPYYLAEKAQEIGYHPEIILSGRRINDNMAYYVADEIVKAMIEKNVTINNAKVLVLGFTFKENCPDIRNTQVINIVNRLKEFKTDVTVHDPVADDQEIFDEYGLKNHKKLPKSKFDVVVLAVSHKNFEKIQKRNIIKENGVIYDIKSFFSFKVDRRL